MQATSMTVLVLLAVAVHSTEMSRVQPMEPSGHRPQVQCAICHRHEGAKQCLPHCCCSCAYACFAAAAACCCSACQDPAAEGGTTTNYRCRQRLLVTSACTGSCRASSRNPRLLLLLLLTEVYVRRLGPGVSASASKQTPAQAHSLLLLPGAPWAPG